MAIGEAKVPIVADTKKLKETLAVAKNEVRKAQIEMANIRKQKINQAAKQMKEKMGQAGKEGGTAFSKKFGAAIQNLLGPRFSRVMSTAGQSGAKGLAVPMLAGIAAITLAIGALIAAWKLATKAIAAFVEHERVLNRISAVLRITGEHVGLTTEEIRNMAKELSRVGVISEQQLLKGAAIITTFTNITGKNFERAVKSVGSLSRAMGVDARAAALQLAKALSQPETGLATLREAGVIFTEQQREMVLELAKTGRAVESQNMIFEILAENGIADNLKATDSLADQWDRLKNASNQLLVAIGKFLGIALNGKDLVGNLATAFEELADSIESASATAKEWGSFFGDMVDTLIDIGNPLEALTLESRKNATALRQQSNAAEEMGLVFAAAGMKISEVVKITATANQALKDAAQKQGNFAKDALDKVEAKRKQIAESRDAREARRRNKILADEQTGVNSQLKLIKDFEKERKSFEGGDAVNRKIANSKKEAEATDENIKKVQELLRAERKRRIEEIQASGFGAAGLFEERLKKRIDAVNKERQQAKDAAVEELEDRKRMLDAQKEAQREELNDLKKLRADKIAERKAMVDAILEIERDKLKGLRELASEFTTRLVEESALDKVKTELRKVLNEAAALVKEKVDAFRFGAARGDDVTSRQAIAIEKDIKELNKLGLSQGVASDLTKVLESLNAILRPEGKAQGSAQRREAKHVELLKSSDKGNGFLKSILGRMVITGPGTGVFGR